MARSATVACSHSAASAIIAFSSASIFRLGSITIDSVYHDGANTVQIKPLASKLRSTSPKHRALQTRMGRVLGDASFVSILIAQ